MKPLFIIVDGTSLAYRAFFAFIKNPLRNTKGENTSAPFAFTNSILKLKRDYKPDYIAIVFDAKGKTKRHEIFEKYKATRPPMPDELTISLERIRKITEALNIKIYEVPGYEADDSIATLVKKAKKRKWKVVILTSDKDLLQLVDEDVQVLDTRPKEDIIYTREKVIDKFGVPPEKIPDYLALIGDSIDNIPGVSGIGEKTAMEVVNKFESIDDLIENYDKIDNRRIRKLISENIDKIKMAKDLIKLDDNIEIEFDEEELKLKEPDYTELLKILKEMEFHSIMEQFSRNFPEFNVMELEDTSILKGGFTFSIYKNNVFIKKDDKFYKTSFENIENFLKNQDEKRTPDLKSAFKKFIKHRIDVKGKIYDPVIAEYLLAPEKENPTLERIALERLGFKFSPDITKRKLEEIYLVDSVLPDLMEELIEKDLYKLYCDIEIPLAGVLAEMEEKGVYICEDVLKDIEKEINFKLDGITDRVYEIAGIKFNINSPKQLSEVLFKKLKLPPKKRTKTGYSTDYEVLTELSREYEIARLILNYRELFKIKSTYIDVLVSSRNPFTGRINASFSQTKTSTGRLSCSNPNLQTIPIKSETGRNLRKAFCAPSGYFIICADYSQIELRILAHFSEDENLIKAFEKGEDIHSYTASLITGKDIKDITSDDRRKAKTVNFGICYGISPFGLSKELGITPEEASGFIAMFFASFPKVKEWIEKELVFARKNGFVKTLFGRIRNIPDINHPIKQVREQAERIAVNTPIQGTAADIIKKAMIDIHREFKTQKLDAHIILQIHDELLFEVNEKDIKIAERIIKEKMENAFPLKVPLKVHVGTGKNWYDVK